MIAKKHHGRTCRLAAALAASAAVASGYASATAWADASDVALPASSAADTLSSSLETFINGVSPDPSMPGDLVTFSGSSSLFNDLLVAAFDSLEPLEKELGNKLLCRPWATDLERESSRLPGFVVRTDGHRESRRRNAGLRPDAI